MLVAGVRVESGPVLVIALTTSALAVAVGLFLLFRWFPRSATAVWCAALFLTPVYVGTSIAGFSLTALSVVTVIAIAASFGSAVRWSIVDTLVALFFVSTLLAMLLGGSLWPHVQQTLVWWLLPYIWGRFALEKVGAGWVSTCVAAGALVAATMGIVESATGTNLWVKLPGASASVWGAIQERAGFARIEGAFGHSIALGGTLAMCVAFVLVAPWPTWVRSLATAVLGVAVALTFSRLGIVGFALTVLLSVALMSRQMGRRMVLITVGGLAVGALAALPQLFAVFGDAGSEAEGSADYRLSLASLIDSIAPLGISPAHETLATGIDYWGGFRSIDSAVILAGLQFGFIPLGVLLILLLCNLVSLVRSPSPANVALAAQIPAFATVALITQYSSAVWFFGGLAVAWHVRSRRNDLLAVQPSRQAATS